MELNQNNNKKKQLIRAWLPVILWAGVIFFFSSDPDPYKILPQAWLRFHPLGEHTHSSLKEIIGVLSHFSEYAILAFLFFRAMHYPAAKRPGSYSESTHPNLRRLTGLVILFTMLYALSDETHQLFVPEREFQLFDLTIDLLGTLLGVFLYRKYHQHKLQKTSSPNTNP